MFGIVSTIVINWAGFCDSQDAYIGYPNSLLCMRYMHEVGKMIIGDSSSIDAGEVKEGDNIKVHSKIARLKNWDSKSDTTNVTSHSSEVTNLTCINYILNLHDLNSRLQRS